MSIAPAIYTFITGASTSIGNRLYPRGEIPNTPTFPYATFQKVDNAHTRVLAGGSGIASPRYDFWVWANTQRAADEAFDELRNLLDNATPSRNAAPWLHSYVEDDDEIWRIPRDDSKRGRFASRMELRIWHAESVTPA